MILKIEKYFIRRDEMNQQTKNKTKRKEKAVIYEQTCLAPGIYSLWIKADMAKEAKAGQFIGVYLNDKTKLLARPISICDVKPEESLLRMVYRAGGEGTKLLSTYTQGTEIDVIGILGNGYENAFDENNINLEGKKIVVIGGGIGIPPMLLAAKTLANANKEIVLGYANNNMFLKDEFDAVPNGKVTIATDDGSVGTKGTVIDAMKANGITGDILIACGPMPMLRALKAFAAENNMDAFISLEERMACGIGACLGCVCKTTKKDHHTNVDNTRICVEGPVFNANDVEI